jgi:hypothetical protein
MTHDFWNTLVFAIAVFFGGGFAIAAATWWDN